jgi:hypothetical protein
MLFGYFGVVAGKAWWRRGDTTPYTVEYAEAPEGWGPLLYDVAMEAAGPIGLTSDRKEVSDEARAVWRHYMTQRPDVRSTLTTIDHEPDLDPSYSERNFHLSPLARVYFANGTPTLNALRRAGKLVVEGEPAHAPLAAVANPADQTDTPAFKRWFGNSKVVDAQGKPLVVYHGTMRGGFDKFKKSATGTFFTDRRSIARSYAHLDTALPVDKRPQAGIYAVFLRLEKPLIVDADYAHWDEISFRNDLWSTDGLAKLAKRKGYDGLIVKDVADSYIGDEDVSTVYVAFDPTQIKSASVNRGTFDPTDPDIRHNPSPRTFVPPKAVADQARMGLALRESLPPSQRCCTSVGIRRAVQLANRQPVSVSTLKRMRSYFQRHAVDARGVGWRETSKGWQAWLCWGSDAARVWCNQILDRLGE